MLNIKNIEPKKGKPLLLPGLIILMIISSGLFLVLPRLRKTLDLRQQIKVEKEKLVNLTVKVSQLAELNQADLSKKAEVMSSALPSEGNLPFLLATFQSLAKNNGVEILSLTASPVYGEAASSSGALQTADPVPISFKISLKGSANQIEEFLKQIKNTAPVIFLNLADVGGAGSETTFMAELEFDSYFLALPTSLGSPEKPLESITQKENEIYQKASQLRLAVGESEMADVPAGKENPFTF